MSEVKPENPPIFYPMWLSEQGQQPRIVPEQSLTLRDLFAAFVAAGINANDGATFDPAHWAEEQASHAYRVADAMLRERSK